MDANQTQCSKLEQRFVIKFLVAEKYKPCEIYKRMCDVNGEVCFSHCEPELKRLVHRVETDSPVKKKFQAQ